MKPMVNKLHDDSDKLLRYNTTIQNKTQLEHVMRPIS